MATSIRPVIHHPRKHDSAFHTDVLSYSRPPPKTRSEMIKEFIWNKKKHTFCSRTRINWVSIAIYYAIFLTVLITTLHGFLLIWKGIIDLISPDGPRLGYEDSSPLASNPQLNFLPLDLPNLPLVRVDSARSIKVIESFLTPYRLCMGEGCIDVREWLDECGNAPFGYDKLLPCVYVKMNRRVGWVPDPFVSVDKLPMDVRKELEPEFEKNSSQPQVWVACQGADPINRDHIYTDHLKFFKHGFEVSNFPFTKQKMFFLEPFIAIQINTTGLKRVLHRVSCSAYAKNLDPLKTKSDFMLYVQ
ncbi:UNVERIFIED_CONTAM: hypothetical protein PYX00_007785 [Menopon gallinae]|uniref:Uncharacterized protein n=1 Tax=Menopon gallinae TaxID=328185 RepID=A0AAW2HKG0_9NEOP